jgi:hypothetical protein
MLHENLFFFFFFFGVCVTSPLRFTCKSHLNIKIRRGSGEKSFEAMTCLKGPQPVVVVSEYASNQILLYDMASARPLGKYSADTRVCWLEQDPTNSDNFFSHTENKISMWDKRSKNQVRAFVGLDESRGLCVAANPGNQLCSTNGYIFINFLIARDSLTTISKETRVWDIGSGRTLHKIPAASRAWLATHYSNIVCVEHETEIRLYDLLASTEEPQKVLGGYPPSGMTEMYLTSDMLIVFGACGLMWRAKYDGTS